MNKLNKTKFFSAVSLLALSLMILPLASSAQSQNEPFINMISPGIVGAGSNAIVVTINGSGFVNGSWVNVNGNPRVTNYISSGQLTAVVLPSDMAFGQTLFITATNPAWVAGSIKTSNTINLAVVGNPPVSMGLNSISPSSASVGSQTVVITANGYGFMNGAVVSFNGIPLTTTYSSSAQLMATIPSAYLLRAEVNAVRVTNPGGMVSNSLFFRTLSTVPGLPDTGVGPTDEKNTVWNTGILSVLAFVALSLLFFGGLAVRKSNK
jgi:hypothetical protein